MNGRLVEHNRYTAVRASGVRYIGRCDGTGSEPIRLVTL